MADKSSRRWLKEHFSDTYVKKAQQEGYRSRAVYKLMEINQRDHLFKPGMIVIELGAAPGSWSQFIAERVKPHGRIIAVDLLPIKPISGVVTIEGDFTEDAVLERIQKQRVNAPIDWVLSDMAPNMSGNEITDIARVIHLAEMTLAFASQVLAPQGGVLIKVFQGEGWDALLKTARQLFLSVVLRKPKASRDRSREIYILAKGLK